MGPSGNRAEPEGVDKSVQVEMPCITMEGIRTEARKNGLEAKVQNGCRNYLAVADSRVVGFQKLKLKP